MRTVVIQVEHGELALMIGYKPASGDATNAILARVTSQPIAQRLAVLRDVMAAFAMQPIAVTLDGKPLQPMSIRAKLGAEPGGGRPLVVLLVTYALPAGGALAVTSGEPRTTRFSWTDRASCRVDLEHAPVQAHWFDGVASFLLTVRPVTGGSACATSRSDSSPRSPR
ncbi:MAG TPA: hypothetical protein VGF94_06770 [Kofleriaceae bacterium]